jgi:putative transcriptional regulator
MHVRFFLGYAGWGAQQLLKELAERAWIFVDNLDGSFLLETATPELWHKSILKQGPDFANFARFPLNLQDN